MGKIKLIDRNRREKNDSKSNLEATHDRDDLPESVFAFPKQRKEPLTDASHVRNVLARFDQVEGASDADRDLAFANIKAAAKYYSVDIEEDDWHQLGKKPHTKNTAHK